MRDAHDAAREQLVRLTVRAPARDHVRQGVKDLRVVADLSEQVLGKVRFAAHAFEERLIEDRPRLPGSFFEHPLQGLGQWVTLAAKLPGYGDRQPGLTARVLGEVLLDADPAGQPALDIGNQSLDGHGASSG